MEPEGVTISIARIGEWERELDVEGGETYMDAHETLLASAERQRVCTVRVQSGTTHGGLCSLMEHR